VSWPAGTFATPLVLTVDSTPVVANSAIFGSGNVVISITAETQAGGTPVTSFAQPLTITFADVPADFVPAVSTDGVNYAKLPLLSGHALPAGQADGYYRDGTKVVVLTRHLTYFAVLDKANFTLSMKIAATPRILAGHRAHVFTRIALSTDADVKLQLADATGAGVASVSTHMSRGVTLVSLPVGARRAVPGTFLLHVTATTDKTVELEASVQVLRASQATSSGLTFVALLGLAAQKADLASSLGSGYRVKSNAPDQIFYRLSGKRSYRVVVLDTASGGNALVKQLHQLYPSIAIVAVTADAQGARAAGATVAVASPVTGARLAAIIKKILAAPTATTPAPTPTVKMQQSWGPLSATVLTRLPAGTRGSSAVASGKQIVVIGGRASTAVLAGAPRAGLRNVATLPSARIAATAYVQHGTVYLLGGEDDSGATDQVLRINLATHSVSVAGRFQEPLAGAASVQVGSHIYVVGGWTGSKYASAVLRFQPSEAVQQHKTLLITRLPVALRSAAVAYLDNHLYVAGGRTATGLSREIYAVDLGNATVKIVGHIPQAVENATFVTIAGKLVLLGGRGANGASSTVTAFDPATGVAATVGHMPQPLGAGRSVVLGGRVYVVDPVSRAVYLLGRNKTAL
jgi:hypothetical protein